MLMFELFKRKQDVLVFCLSSVNNVLHPKYEFLSDFNMMVSCALRDVRLWKS